MKPKITDMIRWVANVALLYGVYTETGVWTVIAITLGLLGIEITTILLRRLLKLTIGSVKEE